jgi:hypothetical protein
MAMGVATIAAAPTEVDSTTNKLTIAARAAQLLTTSLLAKLGWSGF